MATCARCRRAADQVLARGGDQGRHRVIPWRATPGSGGLCRFPAGLEIAEESIQISLLRGSKRPRSPIAEQRGGGVGQVGACLAASVRPLRPRPGGQQRRPSPSARRRLPCRPSAVAPRRPAERPRSAWPRSGRRRAGPRLRPAAGQVPGESRSSGGRAAARGDDRRISSPADRGLKFSSRDHLPPDRHHGRHLVIAAKCGQRGQVLPDGGTVTQLIKGLLHGRLERSPPPAVVRQQVSRLRLRAPQIADGLLQSATSTAASRSATLVSMSSAPRRRCSLRLESSVAWPPRPPRP